MNATLPPQTDTTLDQLTVLFGALADPSRTQILLALMEGEKRSGDLAARLNTSPSAVSHQLRKLREKNLVAARKHGREVYYVLADACVRDILTTALHHIQEGQ